MKSTQPKSGKRLDTLENDSEETTTATSIVKPIHILDGISHHRLWPILSRLVPINETVAGENPIILGERVGKGKQCQIMELLSPKIYSKTEKPNDPLRLAVAKIYPFFPTIKIDSKNAVRCLSDVSKQKGISTRTLLKINDHIRDPKQSLDHGTKVFLPRNDNDKVDPLISYSAQEGRIRILQVYLSEVILLSYVRSLLKRKLSPHYVAAWGFYGACHAGYILLERVDGSLDNMIHQIFREGSTKALRSLLFQVSHAILVMQAFYKIMHYDTNLGNVFVNKVEALPEWENGESFTRTFWSYGLNDVEYTVEHTGWLFKLGDFGFASKFLHPQVIRDDVYKGCFEKENNIIPEFQVGYDLLYLLACVYFFIYYRWVPENTAERQRRNAVCTDFEHVIFQMATTYFDDITRNCVDRWTQWKSGKKEDDVTFVERSIFNEIWNKGDQQHKYALTKCFFDHFYENMVLRPKKEYAKRISPFHFIELPYFDTYRTPSPNPEGTLEISTIMFSLAHFDKFIVAPQVSSDKVTNEDCKKIKV